MGRGGRLEARGTDWMWKRTCSGRGIPDQLAQKLKRHPAVYCEASKGRVAFHAQVGIQNDRDLAPGVRIAATQESGLYEHLRVEGSQHDVLDGGVSTILVFEPTVRDNPEGVLDSVEGALPSGVRGPSVGCEDSEFVRITGYLVRRSDLEGARAQRQFRHDTDAIVAEVLANRPEFLSRRSRSA